METVLKFDRVVLTKELNEKFRQVGKAFEVANILDGGFLLRDASTKVAVGVIGFDDFESYFVKENKFTGWTAWTPLLGAYGETDAFYRTNRKKVQVRYLDKTRAEACCNTMDEFNLFTGIQIAYARCKEKVLLNKLKEYENKLKKVNSEYLDNKNALAKLLNSLGD